jgi:hypothetical protein
LFNTVRQTGGLLGIASIGAILAAQQSAALRHGRSARDAFLAGYRPGLLVAAGLIIGGAVVAYVALRGVRDRPAASDPPAPRLTPASSTRPGEPTGM